VAGLGAGGDLEDRLLHLADRLGDADLARARLGAVEDPGIRCGLSIRCRCSTESAKQCVEDTCHSEGGAARNPVSRSKPWRRPKNLFRKRAGPLAPNQVADRIVRPSERFFGRRTGTGASGQGRGCASLRMTTVCRVHINILWLFVDLVAGEPSDGGPTLFSRRSAAFPKPAFRVGHPAWNVGLVGWCGRSEGP
jgi:hypothetical protein